MKEECELESIVFRRELAFKQRGVKQVFIRKSIQRPEIYIILQDKNDIPREDINFWTELVISFRNKTVITIGDYESWSKINSWLGWKEIKI